jgi:hypothetical protein
MPQGDRPTVRIQVKHGIELQALIKVLEHAVAIGPEGCRACGLNGFDLSFVVDPEARINVKEFQKGVAGIEGVTVSAG